MALLFIILVLTLGLLWWAREKGKIFFPRSADDAKAWLLAIGQSFVLSIAIGWGLWSKFKEYPQLYQDFIAGAIGFGNQSKSAEFNALYITIACFICMMILIYTLFRQVSGENEVVLQGIRKLSLYALIPSAILTGQSLRLSNTSHFLILSSALIILLFITVAILHLLLSKSYIHAERTYEIGAKLFLSILLVGMSDLGLDIFLSRLGYLPYRAGIFSILIAIGLVALGIVKVIREKSFQEKYPNQILTLSQLGIPLILSVLVSPPVMLKSGTLTYFAFKPILYLFLILLGIIAYIDLYKRTKKWNSENAAISIFISPWVLLPLLVFIQNVPMNWPSINPDEYHSGEYYLPWWLLNEHGYLPFVDYQPSRGFINYVPGFLSWLFYDNSFSGQGVVYNHFNVLYIGLAFFSLRLLTGDLVAFLSAASLFDFRGNTAGGIVIAVACLVILYKVSLAEKPVQSLWLWFGSATIAILLYVAEGGIFLLSTIPIAFSLFIKALSQTRKNLFISGMILAIAAGLIFTLTDFDRILIGAVRYLAEQSGINEIAHGMVWTYPSEIKSLVTSGYLWQFVRFSWLLLLIPTAIRIVTGRGHSTEPRKDRIEALFFSGIFIAALMIIPRAAGRIDPSAYSRPGQISIAFITCVLPIIIFTWIKDSRKRAEVTLLFALALGIIGNQEVNLRAAVKLPGQVIHEPANQVSGEALGFRNIGLSTVMDGNQLQRQLEIKSVLDKILMVHETYYDATNHSADYGYQGRPSPVAYPAFYNAPSEPEQIRTIEQLEKAQVPLALIQAENITWDRAPMSLRAFFVYRYLSLNFLPFKDEYGRAWMIRKGEEERLSGTGYHLTDQKGSVALLSETFWSKNLLGLPVSWGRSAKTLQPKLSDPVNILDEAIILKSQSVKQAKNGVWKITGRDPFLIFKVPGGVKGDLLYIELDRIIPEGSMQVYWTSNLLPEFNELQFYSFTAGSSRYFIPVSSAPSWLLPERIKQIRIDLPQESQGSFRFTSIMLYDRISGNDTGR